MFSCDVSSPILVCQNNETAAMLAFSRRSDREEGREKMKTRGGGGGGQPEPARSVPPSSVLPLLFLVFCTLHCSLLSSARLEQATATLVSQTNPVGDELFSFANTFFYSNKFAQMLVT